MRLSYYYLSAANLALCLAIGVAVPVPTGASGGFVVEISGLLWRPGDA